MVVGPFVLIGGLLPLLEADGGGRSISVVSGGMYAQKLPSMTCSSSGATTTARSPTRAPNGPPRH